MKKAIISGTGVKGEITLYDIQGTLSANKEKISRTFLRAFSEELNQEHCNCKNAIITL